MDSVGTDSVSAGSKSGHQSQGKRPENYKPFPRNGLFTLWIDFGSNDVIEVKRKIMSGCQFNQERVTTDVVHFQPSEQRPLFTVYR